MGWESRCEVVAVAVVVEEWDGGGKLMGWEWRSMETLGRAKIGSYWMETLRL